MNLLAFLLVLLGAAFGIAIIVQTGWRNLVGWALVLIATGVLVQETLTTWSHTVHG